MSFISIEDEINSLALNYNSIIGNNILTSMQAFILIF